MASLISKNGILFNCATQAPPPSKDYCQIVVTVDKIIYRFWKITLRKDATTAPGEVKDSYDDFRHDERLHSEINRVFGSNTLEYLKGLVNGHIDYLPRLPDKLLIHIIVFLRLEDIVRLSVVSKQFHTLCSSNILWRQIYSQHTEHYISPELEMLAEAISWKKLFFTNKIQLQMQLSRFKGLEASSASSNASKSTHFDLDIQLGEAAEGAMAHIDHMTPAPPPSKPASKRQSKPK